MANYVCMLMFLETWSYWVTRNDILGALYIS